jgi:hypothetical protein
MIMDTAMVMQCHTVIVADTTMGTITKKNYFHHGQRGVNATKSVIRQEKSIVRTSTDAVALNILKKEVVRSIRKYLRRHYCPR